MKLLTHSNWKQRIVFDNIIYKDVKRYSLMLNTKEREIMECQIDFYRSHFSLLQVMQHFSTLKKSKDIEIFIKAVLKREEYLLYIPRMLKPYFRKLIRGPRYYKYSAFFELLLDKAVNKSSQNITLPMLKTIFGEYYPTIKKKVGRLMKTKDMPIMKKKLKPEALENTARNIIHKLQDDLYMATIYGRSSIRKTVPISIVDEYGYGEWVSKKVTYANNRFFLYSNNNNLTDIELEHMVYFNVYPGYGHFYNMVVDPVRNISFDNGATYLINGWAMYAMTHGKNSAYGLNRLQEASFIAHHLLKKDLEKSYEDIYLFLLGKYTKEKAISYMLDYTQYPCHYLSYILGALAIESSMQKGFAYNPIDFLQTMSGVNCGDFFALYTPKMQKKIAKSSITARVSNKFSK